MQEWKYWVAVGRGEQLWWMWWNLYITLDKLFRCQTQHLHRLLQCKCWTHAAVRLVNLGYMEVGGATEAANAKETRFYDQSANRHLAGISQSEDAALETWNRLNKMKWTKKSKINMEKKNKWDMGKMEDGRNGALRITSKNTYGSKVITMRHSCPNTAQECI